MKLTMHEDKSFGCRIKDAETGQLIAKDMFPKEAFEIVTAVNAFPELLEALIWMTDEFAYDHRLGCNCESCQRYYTIRALIAKLQE